MTKDELTRFCDTELANLAAHTDQVARLAPAGGTDPGLVELAALTTFLHLAAISVEKIIGRILAFDGIQPPGDPFPGQQILKTAGELGIIPPELFQPLSALSAFRIAFAKGSEEIFAWQSLEPLARSIESFSTAFRNEVREYLAVVDAD